MGLQGHSRNSGRGRRPLAAFAALAAVALVAGCRREEITHFRVAKEQPRAALASPAAMAMPPPGGAPGGGGMAAGDVPPPPTPTGASALRWTLPKGWTESLSGGMRYASLKAPVEGRIDGSVVVLPGPAGGELANVNRWRGQIGMPNLGEAELASARRIIKTKAGTVNVYDFTSDGKQKSRLVAGLTSADGMTWFVKLTGDATAVGTARADFIHLLESLRFEETARH